ncbi:MAG: hypothetical protein ABL949_06040 [Fimbriimonadaceae bacterium]
MDLTSDEDGMTDELFPGHEWEVEDPEPGAYDPEERGTKPLLLLLSIDWNVAYTATAKRVGRHVTRRELHSSPANWQKIVDQIRQEAGKNPIIVCRLTEYSLLRSCAPEYKSSLFDLLAAMKAEKHLLMMHSGLLGGDLYFLDKKRSFTVYGSDDKESKRKATELELKAKEYGVQGTGPKIREALIELVQYIRSMDLNIRPYQMRYDAVSVIASFIQDPEDFGDVIRIFIPRSLASRRELERLIELVREYCSQIGLSGITVSRQDTATGAHFTFSGGLASGSTLASIEVIFREFGNFLSLCTAEPKDAKTALVTAGVDPTIAGDLVDLVSKEGRRLKLDLAYTKEKGELDIKYKATESLFGLEAESSTVGQQISPLTQVVYSGTINLITQVGDRAMAIVTGDVANVQGDLVRFISDNSEGMEQMALVADSAAIADPEVASPEKVSAYNRIKRFLGKHSDKFEDVAIKVFLKWMEDKIIGK